MATETQHHGPIALHQVTAIAAEQGLARQVLATGEQMMLVRHVLRAGWEGARHSHPHEQLVYVIRGRLIFTRGTEEFQALPGDSFVVPGGIEHQAIALEESEVLDVFAPPREDYEGLR
ncbi:MAG: cupin domain-containing protein [Acidobacteriota bacterium]